MKVLLDTNIIIHREANRVVRQEIGTLFYWLDRLTYQKYIHPLSIDEIRKHKDPKVVATIEAKVKNYHLLKTLAPETAEIQVIRKKFDKNDNDYIDTSMLKEVFSERIDLLITEDRRIHEKAQMLGIADRVFKIDTFLEKSLAENPELEDYKVLSVKQEYFGNIDIADSFFESFRQDYVGFESWFNKKADETAYTCRAENGDILAFLYVKVEDDENYRDIDPSFEPKHRLKIGTFKVIANGYKLGERFLKIIFDNAMKYHVKEIYVTLFNRNEEQERLSYLLQDWGFKLHGTKHSQSGEEQVYVRDFTPSVKLDNPCLTYPYISRKQRKFIVPIYPEYHTELFPDSILRTESPANFVENRPNRNAISKVYISRSHDRSLVSGDIVVFYRTKDEHAGYYTSVTTTIGVVQNVVMNISNIGEFTRLCRKRSVFSDEKLAEYWNRIPGNYPFIVNFLYVYSFRKKLILRDLKNLGIIASAPRGFERITDESFQKLLEYSNANQHFIVD